MSNKQEFIQYVEWMLEAGGYNFPENAQKYFDALKSVPEKEKPLFTDGGKLILKYAQENYEENESVTAKIIAEGMGISSRSVSGALRKLVADGFMEKVGTDPVVYAITEKGKKINID